MVWVVGRGDWGWDVEGVLAVLLEVVGVGRGGGDWGDVC